LHKQLIIATVMPHKGHNHSTEQRQHCVSTNNLHAKQSSVSIQ